MPNIGNIVLTILMVWFAFLWIREWVRHQRTRNQVKNEVFEIQSKRIEVWCKLDRELLGFAVMLEMDIAGNLYAPNQAEKRQLRRLADIPNKNNPKYMFWAPNWTLLDFREPDTVIVYMFGQIYSISSSDFDSGKITPDEMQK